MPARGLRQYHLSEQEIAGLFATETCHPPLFNIPRHAHDLASFYVVLEGSLTEFYDRTRRDFGAYSIVFTPPVKFIATHSTTPAGAASWLSLHRIGLIVWRSQALGSRVRLTQTTAN